MISHFFIDRPIFATVLSVAVTLAGGLAVFSLPTAQYPPISPPQVQVAINYPGASAQVVADTVAAPIEQQVNGVPGMLYMTSLSGNNGTYTLFVTFSVGTDLNTALVMVQNRVQLALPLLPTSVQNQGITIRKKTPDILMVINLYSPDGRYDQLYLSNFAQINLYDPLLRVDGVSDIGILGQLQYSMRPWLDPAKLASRNMSAADVATAVANPTARAAVRPPVFGSAITGLSGSGAANALQVAGARGGPAGLPGFPVTTGGATTATTSGTTTMTTSGTTTTGTMSSGTTGSTTAAGTAGGATTGGGATSPGGGT